MIIKHTFSSVFLGVFLVAVFVSSTSYAVLPHTVKDQQQIQQVKKILKEREKSTEQLTEATKELKKMNATLGTKSVAASDEMQNELDETIEGQLDGLSQEGGDLLDGEVGFSGLTDAKENRFIAPYISDILESAGLSEVQEKASDTQAFVRNNLLSMGGLDDTERAERANLRDAARRDAAIDAYAVAVAYLSESTKAQSDKIDLARSVAESKETIKDKQDGANEIALARLVELIEGNRLLAMYLRLQAANSMATFQ